MLKQKSKGHSPLLDGGKPKIDEVKVAPVDDLVAQMEAANAKAVKELNEPRRDPDTMTCCRYGCTCPPCRAGRCDLHGAGRDWQMYDNQFDPRDPRARMDYRRGMYGRESYDDRDRYDNYERRMAYEWMRYGGQWDERRNRPEIRDEQEYRRWREFEYRFEREFGRPRREEEEYRARMEYRRRMMELENAPYVPMNIDIGDKWKF